MDNPDAYVAVKVRDAKLRIIERSTQIILAGRRLSNNAEEQTFPSFGQFDKLSQVDCVRYADLIGKVIGYMIAEMSGRGEHGGTIATLVARFLVELIEGVPVIDDLRLLQYEQAALDISFHTNAWIDLLTKYVESLPRDTTEMSETLALVGARRDYAEHELTAMKRDLGALMALKPNLRGATPAAQPEFVIWWLGQSHCNMINVFGDVGVAWPAYLILEFQRLSKRQNQMACLVHNDRFWIAEELGFTGYIAWQYDHEPCSTMAMMELGGIVLRREDVHHIISLPGFVTDLKMRPLKVAS